jgi:arylsulfatase A-like enzyme
MTLFLWAMWFGLITGLLEISQLLGAKVVLHRAAHVGWNASWMSPVADVLLFTALALVFAMVSHLRREFAPPRLIAFTFCFLAALSLLVMHPRLHWLAILALALGLARITSGAIHRRLESFDALVRYSLGKLLVLVAVMGVAVHGSIWAAEIHALSKLPNARRVAPNVLVIVLDTVRATNLSVYGSVRATSPNLELLAQKGVAFDRAMSAAPWTLTSHASMFTGRFPHDLSADWRKPLDGSHRVLAEVFRDHGYLTAGFVANTDVCSYEWGLNRGFAHYEDYVFSVGELLRTSSLVRVISNDSRMRQLTGNYEILGRKTAEDLNRDFLQWLSNQERERPFFAFLNYFDAHRPYLPPEPFSHLFSAPVPRANRYPALDSKWSEDEIQGEIDAYDGSIAYLDHQIGTLVDELDKRRLLKNTLVVVTSDHGEEFGEHGLFSHGNSLYLPSLHVPLIISFPTRVPAGKRVPDLVTLRDLPTTILELAELAQPRFPGNSLSRFWMANDAANLPSSQVISEVNFAQNLPAWFPVSKGDLRAVASDGWHYIRNGDGREELYNLETDEREVRNLAALEENGWILQRLRRTLDNAYAGDAH